MDPHPVDEFNDADTLGVDIFCEAVGLMLCVFAVIAAVAGDSMPVLIVAGLGVYGFGSSLTASLRHWLTDEPTVEAAGAGEE